MPTLRFILGRAGSGKTHHCLESIRACLRAQPDGAPLILLAPEQSTFQLEQALAATPGLDGFFRAHVLSFRRLAHRVFDELGGRTIPPAGNLKRLLILKTLLARRQKELRFYGASSRTVGFAQSLDATLTEWRRYGLAPEAAMELARAWEASHPWLSRKLHDLALIEGDYRAGIANRFLDPEDYLDRFAAMAPRSALLRGARVWVDGFADFTAIERRALMALLRVAESAELALCLDPDTLAASRPDRAVSESSPRPFAACERTYWRLDREAREAGLSIGQPLALRENPRFVHAPVLGRIEQRFFDVSLENGGVAGLSSAVRVVRAQSLQAEVRFVALEALRLAREEGLRFGEMAVITRDLDRCHDLLRAELNRLRIPFFMDRQREIASHPLAQFAISAAETVAGNWRAADVAQALKTGLLPVEADEADRLENHALAWGIDGEAWKERSRWGEPLAEIWARATAPLMEFEQALGRRPPAGAFADALGALLERIGAARTLEQWSEWCAAAGDLEMAAEHRQALEQVLGLLDEWHEALGRHPLSRRECADLLSEGIAALRLRLSPPTLDHLLVGSVERSRHPDLRVAFLLGMNTGVFPKPPTEDPLLNDIDRGVLSGAGVELAPSARERLLNEPFLAYIALTRPSERLIITRAASDDACRALESSPYLERVQQIAMVAEEEAEPPGAAMHSIVDLASLGAQAAQALGPHAAGESPPPAPWPALMRLGHVLDDAAGTFSRRIGGLWYRNAPCLGPQLGQILFRGAIERGVGVTRFETFARCPFQHFLRYGLDLRVRQQARLESKDLGSLLHETLARLFARLHKAQLRWDTADLEQLHAWAEEILREEAAGFRDGVLNASARGRHLVDSLSAILRNRVAGLHAEARASRFRQIGAETAFGFSDSPYPAFEVDLGGGTMLRLNGRIDRLDFWRNEAGQPHVRIIDYKTGGMDFDAALALEGLQLQLPVYLLAMSRGADGERWVPAGFFYAPIVPRRSDIEHLGAGEEAEEGAMESAFKARGIFAGRIYEAIDSTLGGANNASRFYNLKITQKGDPYKNCDAVADNELSALLRHSQILLRRMGQRIIEGGCAIEPYAGKQFTACTRCDYAPVCRFDASLQQWRKIQKRKREEAITEMLAMLGEG